MEQLLEPPVPTDAETQALEAKIRRAKTELERMIDLNPQPILLTDADQKIVRANRALLGLVRCEDYRRVLGAHLNELFRAKDSANTLGALAEQTTEHPGIEADFTLPDGGEASLRFTVAGGDPETRTSVIVVTDVAREREIAGQVEKLHKLEAVQALLGALMHHLNQPLTVIMVRASLLLSSLENGEVGADEMKKTLKDITDLAMSMANVLKKVEQAGEYTTQPYVDDIEILKIDPVG